MSPLQEHAKIRILGLGLITGARIFDKLRQGGGTRDVVLTQDLTTGGQNVEVSGKSVCIFREEAQWEQVGSVHIRRDAVVVNKTCGAEALEKDLRKSVPKDIELSECITPCSDCPKASIYKGSAL